MAATCAAFLFFLQEQSAVKNDNILFSFDEENRFHGH
jgi:hypothetical protein